ncbi:hypothetical protein WJX74_010786 [Apatococcus lobatus]|uniref:Uncharacterized protein n=1 Tax=Apatococcus lobatus TaxID=904363 RepID=A0AAW1QDJ3_9CHLO
MGSSPFKITNTNAPVPAVCHTQLTSSLAAHNHQCSRFCSFKYLFGNVWLCTSSGKHHVCDRTCDQRIFWGNHHTICRLSKIVTPNTPNTPSCRPHGRKRCSADPNQENAGKRQHSGSSEQCSMEVDEWPLAASPEGTWAR